MRRVVRSRTFDRQLKMLLDQGAEKFGTRVVEAKLKRIDDTLEQFLSHYPAAQTPHPKLGLRVYPISRTPFVVLYDFDDDELRVHFILHRSANLGDLDSTSADWEE